MNYRYENLLTSSFLLWLDHTILTNGAAFTNKESKLYPATQVFQGYTQYNFPYSQLVSDASVPGSPQIPTGLYLNSTFVGVGTSGLMGINYDKGAAYFSTGLAASIQVSGRYAVKDVNVSLPNIADLGILFETKLGIRNKVTKDANSFTGVKNDELAYPVMFIRNIGGSNAPYQFGGVDLTTTHIGGFLFTDSQFLLDATCSIIKDEKQNYIPLLDSNEMPFNNMGSFKNNVPYNYTGITANKIANGSGVWLKDIIITDFTKRGLFQEVQSLTNDAYFAPIDFEVCIPRLT